MPLAYFNGQLLKRLEARVENEAEYFKVVPVFTVLDSRGCSHRPAPQDEPAHCVLFIERIHHSRDVVLLVSPEGYTLPFGVAAPAEVEAREV